MRELLQQRLVSLTRLSEVADTIISVMGQMRQNTGHLGYVAGIIGSDGHEHIERNLKILAQHTSRLAASQQFPVFSSTDVFTYERLRFYISVGTPVVEFQKLWQQVLESGYVTNIFMTPRWEQSYGATDEHRIAKRLGLIIHYL